VGAGGIVRVRDSNELVCAIVRDVLQDPTFQFRPSLSLALWSFVRANARLMLGAVLWVADVDAWYAWKCEGKCLPEEILVDLLLKLCLIPTRLEIVFVGCLPLLCLGGTRLDGMIRDSV
jgi:hypothetical protein